LDAREDLRSTSERHGFYQTALAICQNARFSLDKFSKLGYDSVDVIALPPWPYMHDRPMRPIMSHTSCIITASLSSAHSNSVRLAKIAPSFPRQAQPGSCEPRTHNHHPKLSSFGAFSLFSIVSFHGGRTAVSVGNPYPGDVPPWSRQIVPNRAKSKQKNFFSSSKL
jgi:hypothetical protein